MCPFLFVCHSGLFLSYVAQGLCFKAGLNAKLLNNINNIKMIFIKINLIYSHSLTQVDV